ADIRIVHEGIRVVSNLDSVPTAAVILVGLIYGLNLADPADLRYTFEVLQKITMELDGGELSNKTLFLKNCLYETFLKCYISRALISLSHNNYERINYVK
uniref:Uncharacterized protein n=1 Tax=Poecilia reticulata TaxID=8081 RepID=A0A3P9P838_POERE